MRYLLSFCLAICLLAASPLLSQDTINFQMPTSINLDGSPPDGSAILDVNATDRGLLVPRLTTSQRTAIPLPATGLLVYDTDAGSFWYYENNTWNELAPATVPSESGINPAGIPIPDNDLTGITSVITLADPDTVATDTRFRVCVDITHTWTGDLYISLETPDGTTIDLSSGIGSGSNYSGTCFTTEATAPVTGGNAPFSGNWQPEEPFSAFVGKTIAGDWKLKVVDDTNGNTGQLNYWSLQLSRPGSTATLLADADGDTRVTVEDLPDEDIVRLEAGGGVARLEVRPDSAVFSGRLRVLGNFVSGDGSNTAPGFRSFVGGGASNTASGSRSFVGGSSFSTASGSRSFVGGGASNTASGLYSFVGGGVSDTASGNWSFVGSGALNTAFGDYSFVGGGFSNTASGFFSFSGGGVGNTVASRSQATFGQYSKNLGGSANNWVLEDPLFVIGNGTGTAEADRSNAVTVLKNGNVGIGTDAPEALVDISGGAFLVQGNTGDLPVSGAGTRLMWVPAKQAFRAGMVDADQWDDGNIGIASFVGGGSNNTALGFRSFVGGGGSNNALGNFSFVGGGSSNTASGFRSFVGGGLENEASGNWSFAGGGTGNNVASRSQATFGEFSKDLGGSPTLWFPTDPLFVIGNGTSSARSNAVTVLKNGNVGIGPEAPQNKLHVETDLRVGTGTASLVVIADKPPAVTAGGSNQASVFTTAGTGSSAFHIGIEIPSNDLDDGFYIATDANSDGTVDKLALKVRADGKVGIGTATPDQLLTISDASEPVLRFERTNSFAYDYEAYTTLGGKLIFRGGADGTGAALTDFVTFDDLGKVGLSTTSPSADLHIKQSGESSGSAGGLRLERSTSTNNWKTFVFNDNDLTFAFNGTLRAWISDFDGSYGMSSDRRLKKNIEPLPSVLPELLQLRPVRYHFKDVEETRPKSFGFIAQEVQPLFPDVVGEKNGYLSMNYGALGIIAIQAIQEQQAIIEKQQSEIEHLQSQLSEMDKLKSELSAIRAALEKAGIAPE